MQDARTAFKQARMAAIKRYKERAARDLEAATGRNTRANAERRISMAERYEKEYTADFWSAKNELGFKIFLAMGCNLDAVSAF